MTTPGEPYTTVSLPDGELRIWEPSDDDDSDDLSRMYVLDVLGICVRIRWKDDGQAESIPALYVGIDYNADSVPVASGILTVGVGNDVNDYGIIEPDVATTAYPIVPSDRDIPNGLLPIGRDYHEGFPSVSLASARMTAEAMIREFPSHVSYVELRQAGVVVETVDNPLISPSE